MGSFVRHHICEAALLIAIGIPLVAIRPDRINIGISAGLGCALFVLLWFSDSATTLRLDDDGVEYFGGGRSRSFVAWSEVGQVVPRRFRFWPAEDALVFLDHTGRPLLVATVSMFAREQVAASVREIRQYVPVTPPVRLSPFTARANGERHPELSPERTSERFLVSATGGFILTVVCALLIYFIFER